MIGLILAGGNGTRLYPLNQVCSKQMLPVYDKPLIYYPISNLLLLGIREFVIIIKKTDKMNLYKVLGNGSRFGIKINYVIQEKPNGIPEALILGEKYLANKKIFMILGDNIFYGNTLTKTILSSLNDDKKINNIFLYETENPNLYGVVKINKKNNKITKIFEKPKKFISNLAVTGLYIFEPIVISYAKKLKKSKRGEYEITDLLNLLIKKNQLNYQLLERGIFWIDAGSPQNLFKASQMIELIETRNKNKLACIEEICYEKKFITKKNLKNLINRMPASDYRMYLKKLIK